MNLGDVWPMLDIVMTWTEGSCRIALDRLRPYLPPGVTIFEMGYSASELRGTVPLEADRPDCVPLLGDVFFEFVERSNWEAGDPRFLGLADLKPNIQYYVFVTTIDGLYRYDMNDIVEAGSWIGAFSVKPVGSSPSTWRTLSTSTARPSRTRTPRDRWPRSGTSLGISPGGGVSRNAASYQRPAHDTAGPNDYERNHSLAHPTCTGRQRRCGDRVADLR
jgi:hypothetical protein